MAAITWKVKLDKSFFMRKQVYDNCSEWLNCAVVLPFLPLAFPSERALNAGGQRTPPEVCGVPQG